MDPLRITGSSRGGAADDLEVPVRPRDRAHEDDDARPDVPERREVVEEVARRPYWSQRLRMGWSSKGLIVRVTMPSMTPSLGFFFHLRTRLWGRGGGVGGRSLVEHRRSRRGESKAAQKN